MESKTVPNELLLATVLDLRQSNALCLNKWVTIDALRNLIHIRYDFNATFDFTSSMFKKRIQTIDHSVRQKVVSGNTTGVHLRTQSIRGKDITAIDDKDCTRKPSSGYKIDFVLLSSNITKALREDGTINGPWLPALKESHEIVNNISPLTATFPTFASRSRLRGNRGLCTIDHMISTQRKTHPISSNPSKSSNLSESSNLRSSSQSDSNLSESLSPSKSSSPNKSSKLRSSSQSNSNPSELSSPSELLNLRSSSQSNSNPSESSSPSKSSNPSNSNPTKCGSPPVALLYWVSPNAWQLFQPRPEESVPKCLQRRIAGFELYINNFGKHMVHVTDGGEDNVSEISKKGMHRTLMECIYVLYSYRIALQCLGQCEKTYMSCRKSAIVELRRVGFKFFNRMRTVYDLRRPARTAHARLLPTTVDACMRHVPYFSVPEASGSVKR